MVREHTEKVKPPRALWVPFPFGRILGEPDNSELQTAVVRAALALLDRKQGPVLEEWPESRDPTSGQDISIIQASSVQPALHAAGQDVAFEVTSLRPYYEQWLKSHDLRTGVGLSGVDQRRFRSLVRFLEGYAETGSMDLPQEVSEQAPDGRQFMRWAVDDLKAFYLEARLAQKPAASFQDVNTWFWAETALADLLRRVVDRLKSTGDPVLNTLAFGIAR